VEDPCLAHCALALHGYITETTQNKTRQEKGEKSY
jgi:hypothetical protein